MTIGLSGASRSGKTTLARHFSEESHLRFVQTTTSQVFERMNIDPSKPMSFGLRMTIQDLVLDQMIADLSVKYPFISDRTPLDCAAYVMADINQLVGEDDYEAALFDDYIARCFESTNRMFGVVVLVQPGIDVVLDPRKRTGSINKPYMEMYNTLLIGLMQDARCQAQTYFIRRDLIDIKDRELALSYAMRKSYENACNLVGKEVLH